MSSAHLKQDSGSISHWRGWPRAYGLAISGIVGAAVIRQVLDALFGFRYQFLPFWPVITAVALLGGIGPALFATFLSTAIVLFFFIVPVNTFLVKDKHDLVGLLLFAMSSFGVSFLGDVFRRRARRSEEFQSAVEGLEEMLFVVDRSYQYLIANRAFLAYRGVSEAELIGRTVLDVAGPYVFGIAKEKMDECFTGKRVHFDIRYRHATLGERDLSVSYLPIEGPGGIEKIATIINDITEQKRVSEALRQREHDYRQFVAQSSEGIFREELDEPIRVDLPEDELIQKILQHSYVAECNDALARMYGFESNREIIGKRLAETLPPEDPRNIEMTRQYIRSGFRILDRESDQVDLQGNAKVFRNSMIGIVEDGMLLRTWGIQRDVTESKRAENDLLRSEERFRIALKHSPITVFTQDSNLRYTWIYNPQMYWQQNVLGKTDGEILGPKPSTDLMQFKRKALKSGLPLREEIVIPQHGKNHAFDITIEPIFDAGGVVSGITGACMDVARLREITDRLQAVSDHLAQETDYLKNEIETELGFEEIVGQSAELREVLRKTRIVAPTDSTVLLLGETGTGKELVARSLHSLSSRKNKTFVKLNCAAVPSGLLESELFGHEKGAFTSAVSQKVGRIELADKGTLFLDEIGELPLELQPKLLRVLQDREFERLGGIKTIRVDVRIVAATNRDLHQDVLDRNFREDLFYRLNVFPIELPPLRHRKVDIPILVQHFVDLHSGRMGKHIDAVPEETLKRLKGWSWPGNIRELENVIERMVILSKGTVLAPPPAEVEDAMEAPENSLSMVEREHIIRVLRDTNGVLSGSDGAAMRLGLKRTTLQSMLKRFNIHLQEYRRGGNGAYGG